MKDRILDSSVHKLTIFSRFAILCMVLIWIIPTYWLLMTSFKDQNEAIAAVPTWFPKQITFENFSRIFSQYQTPVFRWFANSLEAAILHTLLVLLVATPAAYALAQLNFKFKKLITGIIVSTLFIPGISLLIPNYVTITKLGWLNNIVAIIIPGAGSALAVFFLRQFFITFPRELIEAAILDGCTTLQTFLKIVIPLSKPPIATISTLVFLTNWNDFLWPIYVLISPDKLTLQPGLQTLQSAYTTDYATIMTGATVASIPVLLFFIFAQRYMIEGITRTGIKG